MDGLREGLMYELTEGLMGGLMDGRKSKQKCLIQFGVCVNGVRSLLGYDKPGWLQREQALSSLR